MTKNFLSQCFNAYRPKPFLKYMKDAQVNNNNCN